MGMDIFIIYVIKTLLLPLSSLLIIGVSGLYLLDQHRGFAMALISFSLLMLLLFSLPLVTKYLAATQEIYPPINNRALEHFSAQAIVILGGGLRDPAREYAQKITLKNNTLVRVRYGAILAKQTHLPLLVSGGMVLDSKLPSEAKVMSDVLNDEFHQTVRWQEHSSRNTAENARYTQKILHKEGIQRIVLVTHALHMRRAVEQFEQQGLQVLAAPTEFLSGPGKIDVFSFLPSAKALEKNSLVIHEIMGRVWYKLRY